MCFGSIGKQPEIPALEPIPTPAPSPTVTPSVVSAQSAEAVRKNRLKSIRTGLASTIKTSPMGVTGSGSDLFPTAQNNKDKLG